MRVHFLGTGASPSMPIAFCSCAACRSARKAGGKNLRRRSSLLVDGVVLIDMGPDVTTASFDQSVSLERIRLCLQTHPHEDHLDPEPIISRHPEWGTVPETTLSMVASLTTLKQLDRMVANRSGLGSLFDPAAQKLLRLELVPVEAFEDRDFDGYRVMAYPANHANEYDSLLFSINDGKRAIFYGSDTSSIAESVWEGLSRAGVQFDLMIFDQTYGIGMETRDHLAAVEVVRYVQSVRERGILKADGSVYVTHLSHEGIREHEELENYASGWGYHVAYDGLSLEL
ncbi:MAG TPA: MBL fold metallo-hydrolase [Spirochaetia bacterium]|nr:MBL fold metallo-hydrolase [Spirochaetia bacterium]